MQSRAAVAAMERAKVKPVKETKRQVEARKAAAEAMIGRAVEYVSWARDVLGTPDHQRAEFISRSLRSKRMLHVFGRYFFPHMIRGEASCPEAHLRLISFLASPDSCAIVFPRGFAKSTWERIDTIHDVTYALEPVIVFYGATASDVEQHFDGIKSELETNALLRRVYGSLVPEVGRPGTKWNGKHIRTLNGVHVIGRGAGKGRGVNLGSRRPTKVVIDDGETDEMVRSAKRREKYWRWITEVVEPSLDKERGRLKKIGTVIHPKCAVLRYYEERGGMFMRAIENGESIWPSYWSLDDLNRKRDGYVNAEGKRVKGIGSRAFSQEYLNTPIGEGLTVFRQEWLDSNTWERLPRMEELDVYMAVNPAAGEGSLADDYGLCVIGRHRSTGKRYVLASSAYHGGVGTQVTDRDGKVVFTGARKWFNDAYERWQPLVAGVEAARTVQAFWQAIRDSGLYRCRKLAPSMGIGGAAASKTERAKLVEPHVEQGMVLFHPSQGDLYDQLVAFPSEDVHDDVADAFFHANSLLDAGGAKLEEIQRTVTGTSNMRARQF